MTTLTENNISTAMSLRMKALASMVTKGCSVADIGCDHGYVSVYLYKEGIAPFCIASDVRPHPAEAARKNVELYGAADGVQVRVGDGLSPIRVGETECILIAGMGGKTILSILDNEPEKVRFAKEFVLGPQSEIKEVREYLSANGFRITDEKLVLEDEKYYPLIKAVHASENIPLEPEQAMYGPVLLQRKDEVLHQFLLKRKERLYAILFQLEGREELRIRARRTELQQELEITKKALAWYE